MLTLRRLIRPGEDHFEIRVGGDEAIFIHSKPAAGMLARMFGTAGDGVRDRVTDFSRPVSGAYYFAPSLDVLNELAGPDVDR